MSTTEPPTHPQPQPQEGYKTMSNHLEAIAAIYRNHTRECGTWNVCEITEDIADYLAGAGVDMYPSPATADDIDASGRTLRFAVKRTESWKHTAERIAAYLPANYRVAGCYDRETVVVDGHDVAGWTLAGYVLPRLASGGIYPVPGAHTPDVEVQTRYRAVDGWQRSAHTDPHSAYTIEVSATIDTRSVRQTRDYNGAYRVVNANGAQRGPIFYGPDAADSAGKLADELDTKFAPES